MYSRNHEKNPNICLTWIFVSGVSYFAQHRLYPFDVYLSQIYVHRIYLLPLQSDTLPNWELNLLLWWFEVIHPDVANVVSIPPRKLTYTNLNVNVIDISVQNVTNESDARGEDDRAISSTYKSANCLIGHNICWNALRNVEQLAFIPTSLHLRDLDPVNRQSTKSRKPLEVSSGKLLISGLSIEILKYFARFILYYLYYVSDFRHWVRVSYRLFIYLFIYSQNTKL